jgi:CBS domain-containing protein
LSVVADVMNTDPMVLADTQTVLAAWTQLAERGVGQAPVVTAQGRLVGILTRADLLDPKRLPQPDGSVLVWRALLVQPVTALMVTPVPSVFPDTDLRRLAQALLETGLPGLPVVDRTGLVVGFVSRADILVAVVHDPPLDLWAG